MASPRPVELIGEKMIAFAPLSIMPLMSLFSCWTSDCAFVVIRCQPVFLAVSTWDLVEAIRNGLASFSDCAQPIVAVLKSILLMPSCEPLHIGPYWAATPAGLTVVSTVVPPAARMAAGTPPTADPVDVAWGAADADVAGAPALPEALGALDFEVLPVEQPAISAVLTTTPKPVTYPSRDRMPCLPPGIDPSVGSECERPHHGEGARRSSIARSGSVT